MTMRTAFILLMLLAAAVPCSVRIICVAARKANVRGGAHTAFPVLWVAHRFTPYRVIGSDEDWLNVRDVDGSEGWLNVSVVKEDACVIVVGRKANIRRGPGLDQAVLWEVELGYPFRVIGGGYGGWLEVTDEDEVRGWISEELVWGRTQKPRGES
jgi:SH3-like domain-containing protein